jgi:hypothetical protein
MVDITGLIPDTRAVDKITVIECKAVIQADMFSQRAVDKTQSRDSGKQMGNKCDDGLTLSCHR